MRWPSSEWPPLSGLARLTAQSLWIDEGYSLEYARIATPLQVLGDASDCHATECLSPLHPMLLHVAIGWFGESTVVLRGVSAVAGILAVIALMLAARSFFDDATALIAGALLAVSAFAIWYSQDARPYSLVLLLTALALWGLSLCRTRSGPVPPWRHRLLLALSIGLGLLGNMLFAIGAGALALAHLATTSSRRRWWATWWPAAVAALPAILLVAATPVLAAPGSAHVTQLRQDGLLNLAYAVYGQLVGITFGPPQIALRGGNAWGVLLEHRPALAAFALLLVALAAALVRAHRQRSAADPRWTSLWLLEISVAVGAGLAALLVAAIGFSMGPRHAFFLFPPVVLAVAFALREVGASRSWPVRALAVVAVLLFLGTNLTGVYNYLEDPRYAKDDYRGATAHLLEAERSGEPTALLNGKAVLLRYYGDSSTVDLTQVAGTELIERLQELAARRGALRIALNRQFDWGDGAGVPAALGSVFEVGDHTSRQYFDFYLLTLRRPGSIP